MPDLIPELANPAIPDRSSSFIDNVKLPVHRWFRYSAGFSAQWVKQEIHMALQQGEVKLLDPFAGSATTLITGQCCGVACLGVEAHPFVARISLAKLAYSESVQEFLEMAQEIKTVDQWLGKLAMAAGFRSYTFEKTRDRNTKWRNRKHSVPLHEGRLWVEG